MASMLLVLVLYSLFQLQRVFDSGVQRDDAPIVTIAPASEQFAELVSQGWRSPQKLELLGGRGRQTPLKSERDGNPVTYDSKLRIPVITW